MPEPLPAFIYKKSLGQNFIFDENLLASLLRKIDIRPENIILEIGAGRGDLSLALSAVAAQVVTIEIDQRLEEVLRGRFATHQNIHLHMGDVMKLDLGQLMAGLGPFHVVANLPYYLTTQILGKLLRSDLPILGIHVMLQEEAALRLLAEPGSPAYGPLAVLAAYRAQPRLVAGIPAKAFIPPPKVDSAFLSMPYHNIPPVDVGSFAFFDRLVLAAFAMRRKTLQNNLNAALLLSKIQIQAALEQAGIPPGTRGETLSLQQFGRLSCQLQDMKATQA